MNASPAMETGGPLALLRRHVDAARRRRRHARRRGRRPLDRARADRRPSRTSCSSRSTLPPVAPRHRQRLRAARVPAPDGDRRRRRDRRRRARRTASIADARVAITALAPTIRRVPEAEAALDGSDGGRAAVERGGARPRPPRPRRSRDVRGSADYRRAMAAVITRRAVVAAVARARDGAAPSRPRQPALHGAVEMRYAATLNVNGERLPGRARARTRACSPPCAAPVGLTGSKEGCDDSECGACMMLLDGAAGELVLLPRAPGRGPRGHHRRGARRRRRAGSRCRPRSSSAAASSAASARPGMLDLGDARCSTATRRRPRTRSASRSPATSAAAPGTTASSRPCSSVSRAARVADDRRLRALPRGLRQHEGPMELDARGRDRARRGRRLRLARDRRARRRTSSRSMQERFGLHDLAVEDAQAFHLRPEDRAVRRGRASSSPSCAPRATSTSARRSSSARSPCSCPTAS